MRFRGILPSTLPGKFLLASTLVTLAGGATLAAGFLMRVDNQNSDRVSSGYTASGQYGAVPGPNSGCGTSNCPLGIGAYWLVRRRRRKSDWPAVR
jgi:hypothetical protein